MAPRWFWLGAAFLGSGCSLAYELILAKILANLSGDVMLWESLAMGVFLLFLGIGSFRVARVPDKEDDENLLRVELALSVLGACAPILIYLLHIPYRIYFYDAGVLRSSALLPPAFLFAGANLLFPALIGYVSGYELPLLLRLAAKDGCPEKVTLAAYYFGGLVGTLSFVWLIHPYIDPMVSGAVVAGFNGILLLALLFRSRSRLNLFSFSLPFAVVVGIICVAVISSDPLRSMWLKNFFYNQFSYSSRVGEKSVFNPPKGLAELADFLHDLPVVERHMSRYRAVDIVRDAKELEHFSLHLDGHFQFSSQTAADYHEHFVHVPVSLYRNSLRRVLVLGGGDGLLAHQLLKYSDTQVKIIELDPRMIDLSSTHPKISKLNGGALQDPRVEIVTQDAFVYLMHATEFYDAIYVDFTFPFDFDSARLFSQEFFALVHNRLKPNGFAVAISPVSFIEFPYMSDLDQQRSLRRMVSGTLGQSGFDSFVAFDCDEGSFLAMGMGPMAPLSDAPLPIATEVLQPSYFQSNRWKQIPTGHSEYANSLFKPTFRGVEDTFF